jgi:hypothetical protein
MMIAIGGDNISETMGLIPRSLPSTQRLAARGASRTQKPNGESAVVHRAFRLGQINHRERSRKSHALMNRYILLLDGDNVRPAPAMTATRL